MPVPDAAWVAFTLLAASGQSLRNASQHSLTATIGTLGATAARFLFGLPFGLLFMALALARAEEWPAVSATFFAWIALGSLAQILATALMLAAMRARSFVVTTAYTKTEPVLVALFGLVFLGDPVTAPLAGAILVATAGVLLLSWPSRADPAEALSAIPALLGIASGALFALAAIGFRGGILSLGQAEFVTRATVALGVSLSIQSALIGVWLFWRDPPAFRRLARSWRLSLGAGLLGASASQMWFFAFALETAARVRALGLVEILFAGLISRRFFSQKSSPRDWIGIGLVVAGVAALLNGAT